MFFLSITNPFTFNSNSVTTWKKLLHNWFGFGMDGAISSVCTSDVLFLRVSWNKVESVTFQRLKSWSWKREAVLKGEGEASAQATGEPPGDLSKQVDLQRTIGSWRTSRGPLKSRRAFGGPLRRGPPSSVEEAFRLVRRVSFRPHHWRRRCSRDGRGDGDLQRGHPWGWGGGDTIYQCHRLSYKNWLKQSEEHYYWIGWNICLPSSQVEQVNMAMEMGGSSVGGLVSPLLMGAPSPLQAAPTPPAATPSSLQVLQYLSMTVPTPKKSTKVPNY